MQIDEQKPLKTTIKQDALVVSAVIEKCVSSKDGIPLLGLSLQMKRNSGLVGIADKDYDDMDMAERLRLRRYSEYIDGLGQFCLLTRLCRLENRVSDQIPLMPVEYKSICATRFGRGFIKMPVWVQIGLTAVLLSVVWFVFLIKNYRWVASIASLGFALVRWAQGHNFSADLVIMAGAFGIAAAVIVAWIISLSPDAGSE